MCELDEIECVLPLPAATYRALWLEDANDLGLIAEILADVLGWQSTADEPLPDALALAQEAAARLAGQATLPPRSRHRPISRRALHSAEYALN